jgi:putative DNA primase/helicase
LVEILAKANLKTEVGQELRAVEIAADQGGGKGVFSAGEFDPAALAKQLEEAACVHYGTAGPAFVRAIIDADPAEVGALAKEKAGAFVKDVADGEGGQVTRVARRFGLIAAAGELAIQFGILPWRKGSAIEAVKTIFKKWHEGRPAGKGPAEIENGITQVAMLINMYGDSRFESPTSTEGQRPVHERWGWQKDAYVNGVSERQYLIPTEIWSKHLCKGFNAKDVAKALSDRGVLKVGKDGRHTVGVYIPNLSETQRVYVLTPARLNPDLKPEEEASADQGTESF